MEAYGIISINLKQRLMLFFFWMRWFIQKCLLLDTSWLAMHAQKNNVNLANMQLRSWRPISLLLWEWKQHFILSAAMRAISCSTYCLLINRYDLSIFCFSPQNISWITLKIKWAGCIIVFSQVCSTDDSKMPANKNQSSGGHF